MLCFAKFHTSAAKCKEQNRVKQNSQQKGLKFFNDIYSEIGKKYFYRFVAAENGDKIIKKRDK